MQPRKIDWENLRRRMPGVAVDQSVTFPKPEDSVHSVLYRGEDQWAVYRGTLDRPADGIVTEIIEQVHLGDAVSVLLHLRNLGFTLPLTEQMDGALALPTARDLYWDFCREQMPGEPLGCLPGAWRVAFSLYPVRQGGWKIYTCAEQPETGIPLQNWILALSYRRALPVEVLCWWRANRIGDGYGVITPVELSSVLDFLGLGATDTVGGTALFGRILSQGGEDEADPEDPFADGPARATDATGAASCASSDAYRPLSVWVVARESPSRERIRGRRRGHGL